MKLLLLFILLITANGRVSAQLHFQKVKDLSQNTVYAITKDKQGFMWVATADGLNRFDGLEMKVYKPPTEKKVGLLNGRVIRTKIMEDSTGNLWFATEANTVCFNKKKGYFNNNVLGAIDGKVIELTTQPILQKDGHIWLSNESFGVIDFDIKKKLSKRYAVTDNGGNPVFIRAKGVYDNIGNLWFTSNKGLFSFSISKKKWFQFLPKQDFTTLSYTNDTIIMYSDKALHYYCIKNGNTGKVDIQTKLPIGSFRCMYSDAKLNCWAGDEYGNIYCKKADNATFIWLGNINAVEGKKMQYPVYSLFVDEMDILWVGADVLGLLTTKINKTNFHIFPSKQDETETNSFFTNAIYEESNTKLWIGGYQQGVMLFDKQANKLSSFLLPNTLETKDAKNIVTLVKKDENNNFWIGSSGYLFVREDKNTHFIAIKIPLPKNTLTKENDIIVTSITTYKKGWLVGTSIGLYMLEKKDSKYNLTYIPTLGQTRLSDIWINKKNNDIWIGHESSGVLIAKSLEGFAEGKFLFKETGSGIKSFMLDENDSSILWIGSLSGLIVYHLPTGKYKYFTEANGLGNSYVYGTLQYKNELWVSTNRGLSKAIINYQKEGALPNLSFTNFTSTDGLPDNEFNTGAFHKGVSGNFYFGTVKGITWFNPAEIIASNYLPKIRMLSILINDVIADSTISPAFITKLSLPYFKNNFFFKFRGIEYNNPTQVTYAFKMQGWDKDWVQSGTLNEVRYNQLSPGNYVFKIKAANGAGIWGNEVYELNIIIEPPFWQRWWFYIMIALLLLGTTVLITKKVAQQKLRKQIDTLKRQTEMDAERQRISREMHDDIGAGLTQITLMSESAKRNAQNTTELESIADTSRQLVNSMSEIIWSLSTENITFEQHNAHLREQLHKQLEYSGIEYEIILAESNNNILMSNQQKRNVLLITKELVNNAIKYSKAKNITIHSSFKEGLLTIEVKDDGVGFDTSKAYSGNGLRNTQHRIKEMNGSINISAAPNKGTCFIYHLPLK